MVLAVSGGKPKNLPLFDEADPEVKARTVLFRNVCIFLEYMFFFIF